MPRIPGKAKKIAYSIIGMPPNIADSKKPAPLQKNNRRLIMEETIRMR